MKKKKQQRRVGDAITSDNVIANILLNLKQQPSSSDNNTSTTLPPPTTAAITAATPLWGDRRSRSKPLATDTAVKVVGSTTTCSNCNVSRKRKLDELDHCSTPTEVLAHREMSDEDLSSRINLLLPELLRRFTGRLKVAQRKSKPVERYKKKLADKDEEICQLKDEVKNLKKIATKDKHQLEYKDRLLAEGVTELDSLEELLVVERDRHLAKEQSWVDEKRSVDMTVLNLKNCLQDVQAQLEYKDRLLVEGVTELDSLEELLVAERDRHSAKEQVLVKEKRSVEELLAVERGSHVVRYKDKLADKDEEIRQLKDEIKNLKKIAKQKNQSEVTVLKMCLQDVKAQLEYKDRLLVEGVMELDSLEELLVSERDHHSSKEQLLVEERRTVEELLSAELGRHSAKEQLWVEERRSVEELLVGERDRHSAKEKVLVKEMQALKDSIRHMQSRVEEFLVENRRLEGDRKWLITEGFSHVVNNVHRSDRFSKSYKDFFTFVSFIGVQCGLEYGYQYSAQGVPLEKVDFYRPEIRDKYKLACKWLTNARYPYLDKLSSMADQPLDIIRALKPERRVDIGATKNYTTAMDFANRVEEYLQQLE